MENAPLVYRVSKLSKLFWQEYVDVFPEAQRLVANSRSKIYSFPDFALEVFHRLYYEWEAEVLDPAPPESLWARKLHTQLEEIGTESQLASSCGGNQIASGAATVECCRRILLDLPQPQVRNITNPQAYREAIASLKAGKELDFSPERHINNAALLSQEDPDAAVALLQQEGKQAVELSLAWANNLDESNLRKMLRSSVRAAGDKLEEVAGWLELAGVSWGNEPGQIRLVGTKEKLALASKIANNPQLKRIAKLAGRLREMSQRKRRSKSKNVYGEINSIELGNDIRRLLPSEMQKLAEPDLFPLFARGYWDKSLLQYQFKGKEKQNRGPVVVCLDSSGSMEGDADDWAKAVTSVLLQNALSDLRHFRVIHFDTKVRRVDDFAPQNLSWERQLNSLLSFYSGGGTNWEKALDKAIECVEKHKMYPKADIILITDGCCAFKSDFRAKLAEKKQKLGFSLYGVLIGNSAPDSLQQACDRLWHCPLGEDGEIEELFAL